MKALQTTFNPKQEKIAEFIAYLKNSVIYKDEKGNISIASKSQLNEIITQMLRKKDFVGVAEILKVAKNLTDEIPETAEIVSKSVRIPTVTYLKLINIAQGKNMSLSDTLRISFIPAMMNKLGEFKDDPGVDQKRIDTFYNLLDGWREKEITSAYKDYSPEYRYYKGDEIVNSFKKLIQFSICNKCKKIPKELMEDYLDIYGDFSPLVDIDPRVELEFDPESNLFKLTIYLANAIVFTQYNEFKNDHINYELNKEFDEVLDFVHGDYNEDVDQLTAGFIGSKISGILRIENNKFLFDGVDIKQKNALNALICEKIANEKYAEFVVEDCIKQVHEVLARNDYNTAAQLNEELARFQVTSKIASWYGDIITSIAEESNVVTFTIPKLLLLLWESTKGDRSIHEFVEENLREL